MELVNLLDLQALQNSANSDDESLDESDLRGIWLEHFVSPLSRVQLCLFVCAMSTWNEYTTDSRGQKEPTLDWCIVSRPCACPRFSVVSSLSRSLLVWISCHSVHCHVSGMKTNSRSVSSNCSHSLSFVLVVIQIQYVCTLVCVRLSFA